VQYTQQAIFIGMTVGSFILGRMKGVLLGMGVKEGARVTVGTMNGVDVTNGVAAMVCFCKAIDVLAIIVEIFICAKGVGAPFPLYSK
jgi:hypothetical protein